MWGALLKHEIQRIIFSVLSLLPPLLALGMEPRQPVEEFPKLEGRVSQVLLFSLNGFFNGLFLL